MEQKIDKMIERNKKPPIESKAVDLLFSEARRYDVLRFERKSWSVWMRAMFWSLDIQFLPIEVDFSAGFQTPINSGQIIKLQTQTGN